MKERRKKNLHRAQTTPDTLFGPVFLVATPHPSPSHVFHILDLLGGKPTARIGSDY